MPLWRCGPGIRGSCQVDPGSPCAGKTTGIEPFSCRQRSQFWGPIRLAILCGYLILLLGLGSRERRVTQFGVFSAGWQGHHRPTVDGMRFDFSMSSCVPEVWTPAASNPGTERKDL